MWGMKVIVPCKLQEKVLRELHEVHFGIARTKAISRSYVWWPKLDIDIESLTKSCTHCQSIRNSPPMAPLHPWNWPSKPWQRIHVDFCWSFPSVYVPHSSGRSIQMTRSHRNEINNHYSNHY